MFSDASTMTESTDFEFDKEKSKNNNKKKNKNKNNIKMTRIQANNNSIERPETVVLEPFEVLWKDLTYKVPQKTILNNVSGFFKTGNITAIMGPSGSGKSSLLGCISGQKKTGVSGSITISTEREVNIFFRENITFLRKK